MLQIILNSRLFSRKKLEKLKLLFVYLKNPIQIIEPKKVTGTHFFLPSRRTSGNVSHSGPVIPIKKMYMTCFFIFFLGQDMSKNSSSVFSATSGTFSVRYWRSSTKCLTASLSVIELLMITNERSWLCVHFQNNIEKSGFAGHLSNR